MMKIGERFKDKTTGKTYIIRSETDDGTLSLEGENGLGRRLVGKESLKQTCERLEDIKLKQISLSSGEDDSFFSSRINRFLGLIVRKMTSSTTSFSRMVQRMSPRD